MRYAKCFGLLKFTALAYPYIRGKIIMTNDDADGFGSMFKWTNAEEGFEEAKAKRKPIFLLIYKNGCPTCEKLKPKFRNSIRIHDLSQHFVMMKMKKDGIPTKDKGKFQPDGTYVPRILFFAPNGNLMEDIYNRHLPPDEKYKYFYRSTSEIIDSMVSVLKRYSKITGILDEKVGKM